MLLFSTMVISPAAFVANAAEQYGITINHIFSDGYKADDSYDELYGTFEEGETPLVSIVAPYGYIIENVYFTSPAGEDFALFIEDLEYDNPVSGIYHITMPDYALTMSVVYRCVLNTVVINHIYDGGHCEDDDYQIVIGEDQIAGSVVNFTADPKAGYAIDTMYVLAYAGTSFSNLVDLDIVKVGENTYRFVMPIEPITVNIVYTPIRNSITPVALFDGQQSSNSELYYNGPLAADPGDVVIFYGAEINDYSVPEAFATAGAGSAFVEVIELQEAAGAYYFIMPDTDVTVTLVYSNTRFGITASNIFEDGTEDNTVYYNGADTAVVGERVVFTIDAPQGYAVSEIFGVYSAGSAFVEVFPIDTLAGTYYFDMPDGEVAITIVYTATLFDINFVSYKGTQIDNQWTVADVAAGSTFVFAGNAPAGYAVEDVFALSKVSDTFVEIIPVDDLGNGSYAFEMPAANVDVAIVYKSVLFNVNYASYAGEQLVAEWTDEGIMVGDKHIFAVDAPEGYAVEDVIATTTVNRLFVEVLNVGNLAGAYYFTMPEADVCSVWIYLRPEADQPLAGVDVPRGSLFGEPAAPGHPGEVFLGWFTDRALTKRYDPTQPIMEDTYLFAGWEKVEDPILLGDADNDGKVTIVDATAIQRRLASLPVSSFNEKAADTDGDGSVTIVDATYIQRFLAGLSSNPKIGQPIA